MIDLIDCMQKDMMALFKGQITKKDAEYLVLEEKFSVMKSEKENIQKELETQLHIEKSSNSDVISSLQNEIAKCKEEIEDLQEFKLQKVMRLYFVHRMKADMENELEEIKMKRDEERKRYKEKIAEMDREIAKEKDRLKKELDSQVQDARNKMLDLAHSKLLSVNFQ